MLNQIPDTPEMSNLRVDYLSSLRDTCYIGYPVSEAGQTSPEPETDPTGFVYQGPYPCGINVQETRDAAEGPGMTVTDACLRLDNRVPINGNIRVRVIKRLGVLLETPEYYTVLGSPKRGSIGWIVDLRKLKGETTQ